MAIRLGDEAPDFTAEPTQGPVKFHEWLGDSWGIRKALNATQFWAA